MGFKRMLTYKNSKRYSFTIRTVTLGNTRKFKVSVWDNNINDFIEEKFLDNLDDAVAFTKKWLIAKMKQDVVDRFIKEKPKAFRMYLAEILNWDFEKDYSNADNFSTNIINNIIDALKDKPVE
jgi:hypothetical protein